MNTPEAVTQWESWARSQDSLADHADVLGLGLGEVRILRNDAETGRRAAESLRLEQETGMPHCLCSNPPTPIAQCPKKPTRN